MSTQHPPQEPIHGVFTDLASAISEPPVWILEDLLPRGLTLVVAPPKGMKSVITVAMASLVAQKKCRALPPSMSRVARTGPSIFFSSEATAGELRHIAEQDMGIPLENDGSMLVADDPWLFRLDDDDGLERLFFWLNERDPRVVVIDPLRNFHEQEEKDSGAMMRMLKPLRSWGVAHDAAVVIVHHTRKPMEPGAVYTSLDVRGSSALFGAVDGLLVLSPKGKDNEQTHISATFKRGAAWEKTVTIGAFGREASEVVSDFELQVLEALKRKLGSLDDIRLSLKAGKATVLAACRSLERNGQAKVVGNKWIAC